MNKQIAALLLSIALAPAASAIAQQYGPPPPPPGQAPWHYGDNSRWTPDWDRQPNPDAAHASLPIVASRAIASAYARATVTAAA